MTVQRVDIQVFRHDGELAAVLALRDDDYDSVQFTFKYLIRGRGHELKLTSFQVSPAQGDLSFESAPSLGAGFIRDLPLAGWLRFAYEMTMNVARDPVIRGAAEKSLGAGDEYAVFTLKRPPGSDRLEFESWPAAIPSDDPEELRQRAEQAVQSLYPDLDPNASAGSARRWNSLVRYAEITLEHQANMLKGVNDSVGLIAERRGVAPATVRSWLHRAREAGVTGVL